MPAIHYTSHQTPPLPSPIAPVLFGMGFTLLFNIALFASIGSISGPRAAFSTPTRLIAMVAFMVFAVRSRSKQAIIDTPRLLVRAAAATSAGIFGVLLVQSLAAPSGETFALLIALPFLTCAVSGYCVTFLAWTELLARMSMDYALLYYIVARMLSAVVSNGLGWLPATAVQAVALTLPLASISCLFLGKKALARLPYTQGEQTLPRCGFPWRPVALLATFSFASQLAIDLCSAPSGSSMVGSIAGCALVLVIVLARFKRFDLKATHYLALPLLLASLLCVMLGPGYSTASVILGFAANDVFLAFVYALLFDLSYRRGLNATWTFGIAQAALTAGILASHAASDVIVRSSRANLLVALCIVGVTAIFVLFLTDKGYAGGWGMRMAKTTETQPTAQTLHECCSLAARRYDLTRREEEVLLLRLQGATHRDLETTLVISSNTVKSHIRHIYRKLDVTNLAEARQLVEQKQA